MRAVARRTREVGIRLALGATSAGVVRLLVWHTVTGVIGGLVLGLLGGVCAGKLLSPFLFGVAATDPVTYGTMVGLLTFVSVLASWLPRAGPDAWRWQGFCGGNRVPRGRGARG